MICIPKCLILIYLSVIFLWAYKSLVVLQMDKEKEREDPFGKIKTPRDSLCTDCQRKKKAERRAIRERKVAPEVPSAPQASAAKEPTAKIVVDEKTCYACLFAPAVLKTTMSVKGQSVEHYFCMKDYTDLVLLSRSMGLSPNLQALKLDAKWQLIEIDGVLYPTAHPDDILNIDVPDTTKNSA